MEENAKVTNMQIEKSAIKANNAVKKLTNQLKKLSMSLGVINIRPFDDMTNAVKNLAETANELNETQRIFLQFKNIAEDFAGATALQIGMTGQLAENITDVYKTLESAVGNAGVETEKLSSIITDMKNADFSQCH